MVGVSNGKPGQNIRSSMFEGLPPCLLFTICYSTLEAHDPSELLLCSLVPSLDKLSPDATPIGGAKV